MTIYYATLIDVHFRIGKFIKMVLYPIKYLLPTLPSSCEHYVEDVFKIIPIIDFRKGLIFPKYQQKPETDFPESGLFPDVMRFYF